MSTPTILALFAFAVLAFFFMVLRPVSRRRARRIAAARAADASQAKVARAETPRQERAAPVKSVPARENPKASASPVSRRVEVDRRQADRSDDMLSPSNPLHPMHHWRAVADDDRPSRQLEPKVTQLSDSDDGRRAATPAPSAAYAPVRSSFDDSERSGGSSSYGGSGSPYDSGSSYSGSSDSGGSYD